MHTLLDLHNVLTILEGHLPHLQVASPTPLAPNPALPSPYSIVGIRLGFYPQLPPRYRATFSVAPNVYHPGQNPGQPVLIWDVTMLLYLDGHVLCWGYPPDEALPPSVVISGEPGPLYRSRLPSCSSTANGANAADSASFPCP